MGEWRKILVVAEYKNEMNEVVDFFEWSVDEYVSEVAVLTHNAVLVETLYTMTELDREFKYLEVSIFLVESLDIRQFLDERLAGLVECACREMDISYDIDYFLDLAIDRGGVDRLTARERRRLDKLSRP